MFYTDGKLQFRSASSGRTRSSPAPCIRRSAASKARSASACNISSRPSVPAAGEIPGHAAEHRHRGDRPHRDARHAVALNLENAPLVAPGGDRGGPGGRGRVERHGLPPSALDRPRRLALGRQRGAFDASHVYASGNIAADMYANVTAESSGGCSPGSLQPHRRPRHERDAVLPDRARHHAPAAVAGGDRGARRQRRSADPQRLPTGDGGRRVLLRLFRPHDRRNDPEGRWTDGPRSTARGSSPASSPSPWARSRCSVRRGPARERRRSRSPDPDADEMAGALPPRPAALALTAEDGTPR